MAENHLGLETARRTRECGAASGFDNNFFEEIGLSKRDDE